MSRGLRPGDPLPSERELAAQFDVSRTVIREAVRSLAGKGIIDARPGRGLTIAAVDADAVSQAMSLYIHGSASLDYAMVHEVRAMLEVQVAELAARRATSEEIKRLEVVCDSMASMLDDVEGASRRDVAFHRLLAVATHNELYELLLDAVSGPLMEIRRETFNVDGRASEALNQHREILRYVIAHDGVGARRAMRSHLKDVERVWKRLASEEEPEPRHASASLQHYRSLRDSWTPAMTTEGHEDGASRPE